MINKDKEMLKDIQDKLNAIYNYIYKPVSQSYNLREFTNELGITNYMLKKIYSQYKLAIPAPYRVNNSDPVFTSEDVVYMKKWLTENGRFNKQI